jgi:hypothetical protein
MVHQQPRRIICAIILLSGTGQMHSHSHSQLS